MSVPNPLAKAVANPLAKAGNPLAKAGNPLAKAVGNPLGKVVGNPMSKLADFSVTIVTDDEDVWGVNNTSDEEFEKLYPVAQNELTGFSSESPETVSAAAPATPPASAAAVVEQPTVYREGAVHILDALCGNIDHQSKNIVTDSAHEAKVKAQRIAEGSLQTLATLAQGARVANVAAIGLTVIGISAAATAWPAVLGLAGASVILMQISKMIDLNREVREMILTINSQLQRMHNIYCVIEDICSEHHYPINTEMVRKYIALILSNIMIAAGPDTYKKIMGSLQYQPSIQDVSSSNTTVYTPGHSKIGFSFLKYILGSGKLASNRRNLNQSEQNFKDATPEGKNTLYNKAIGALSRWFNASEILRGLSRDLLLLNVYFTILQSEFDLLSRAGTERKRQDMMRLVEEAEREPNLEVKLSKLVGSLKQNYTASHWISNESYTKFYNQLPKSNLSIFLIEDNKKESIETVMGAKPAAKPEPQAQGKSWGFFGKGGRRITKKKTTR